MEIPQNFAFYGVRKTLPQGDYEGTVKSFSFQEKISKAGKPYVTLSAKVDIAGQLYFVNLSLDPNEKGKALNKFIMQLVPQTGKTEKELIEMCVVPQDFFNVAMEKKIHLISTEKGYLDVWSDEMPADVKNTEVVNPADIPF